MIELNDRLNRTLAGLMGSSKFCTAECKTHCEGENPFTPCRLDLPIGSVLVGAIRSWEAVASQSQIGSGLPSPTQRAIEFNQSQCFALLRVYELKLGREQV